MLLTLSVIIIIGTGCISVCRTTNVTSKLITEIIDEYFVFRQVPLLVVRGEDTMHLDLVDQIIGNLHKPRVIQLGPTSKNYASWFYCMFFFATYEGFVAHINVLSSEQYDLYGFYTFFFNEVTEVQIHKAFDAIWRVKILRALIIVFNDDRPQLYNYFPYNIQSCGKPKVHYITNHQSSQLYLQKLNNFYGCPITLGTFETPPFVHFQGDTVYGFEGDLASTLARQLNFQLLVVTPPDNAQWGDPHPNGSTGLMKLLQEETAHFGVGCLGIMPQRNEILQPGRPHYNSRVLFAVPKGNRFLICLAITVVLTLKFAPNSVRDFIYGANNHTPLLNTINVFYTGALHRVPRRNFARTLLLLWILHCFVMRTVYQGLLFKYLQQESNRKPIDIIDDIEQSKLHYHMNKNAERFFAHKPGLSSRIRLIPPGNDSVSLALDAVSSRRVRDAVVVCTLEHIAYHNKHRLKQGFLRSSRDSLSSYPMVIYYPKRTFLVRVLDRLIGQIETAGLMNFWVQRYGNYHFFPKRVERSQPSALNVEQLMGCFECICVQWMVSCGIFVLELLSYKITFLRRFLGFLTHN
uniref:Putative glutamate-gated kainate-type ion channel receptor subunit glur5 n=1 Tax=Aedes aegypti TaxID=7159 RepID=A0A0P6IX43_AEDAE